MQYPDFAFFLYLKAEKRLSQNLFQFLFLVYSFIFFSKFPNLTPHNNFPFSSPCNKIIDKHPCSIHLQFFFLSFALLQALPVPQPHLSVPCETCFLKNTLAYRDTFLNFYSSCHITVISLNIWSPLLLLLTPFILF